MPVEKEFILDEMVVCEGSRKEGYINVACKPDGSWIRIPVIVVQGEEAGHTFLVDACNHGDEYEGTEGIIKASKALEAIKFKGTFIGVPALNFEAFSYNERISPIDYINLNRAYPGNANSFITSRVANTYMKRMVKYADYIISFHGGGTVLHLEPLVGYQPPEDTVGEMTLRMAKAFGVKVLWKMQNLPFDGVSVVEAKKLGIPAILPEIGSHCSRHHERWKNVDICANGIINVMKEVGMIDGEAPRIEDQADMELRYIHTDSGGIHIPVKNTMDIAKEGEVLARVTDVFGKTVSEVIAPFDGMVLGYWSVPVINPGDWSYLFGKMLNR